MTTEPPKGEGSVPPERSAATPARGLFRGKGGLGRGLGALIPERVPDAETEATGEVPAQSAASTAPGTQAGAGLGAVDIDLIAPNPEQPRTAMDAQQLADLTQSIREHGILQPLVVSRQESPTGGVSYQLIAGERRLHAARAAGLQRVPVVVREADKLDRLELALIENIQRADLNPLEEAQAFQRLVGEFGLTQEAAAQQVGRSRVAVANTLRLLSLSDEIKASLSAGAISEGHARALLGVADPEQRRQVWRATVDRGLSVRETELMVRRLRDAPSESAPKTPRTRAPSSGETAGIAERLQSLLGTAVRIERGRRGGRVVINYYSDEELDALVQRLLAGEEL